jgi:excisionase family DNA binding protein
MKWRVKYITEETKGKSLEMPFWLKLNLTIQEAAAYSNIGINRIEEMLKQANCPFVLYCGRKKLVKRKEFEQFISDNVEI